MLQHKNLWHAIDRLAKENDLTPSGLARRAGLDSTTFNPSKRTGNDGRDRWPSTESIAKILNATRTSFEHFTAYLTGDSTAKSRPQVIPIIDSHQAQQGEYFGQNGMPIKHKWDSIAVPDIGDLDAFALEISGDHMEPAYRDGDRLIVSPNSILRKGDRVVIRLMNTEIVIRDFMRKNLDSLRSVHIIGERKDDVMDLKNIEWIARIVWVSQ